MKLLKLLSTAAVGLLVLAPFSLNAQQVKAATVKTIKVTGTATIDKAALKDGEIFSEGKTIETGPQSRVLIRFSNGAAMSIRENTSLKIATFTQEPITSVKVATHEQIKSEPSKSNTQTNLNYGKVIARAHQMAAKGSKFEINTPTGAAGIRGSIALVTYDPLTNSMTAASLQGTIQAWATGRTTETQMVTIRQNTQVQITGTKDASGAWTSFAIVQDRPITDVELIDLLKEIGIQLFSSPDATIVSPSDDAADYYVPPPPPNNNI